MSRGTRTISQQMLFEWSQTIFVTLPPAYEHLLAAFCAQVYMEQETSVQWQAERPDKEPVLLVDHTARGFPVALPSIKPLPAAGSKEKNTSCITVKKYSRIILLQIYMCL